VEDIIGTTAEKIAQFRIRDLQDVLKRRDLVDFSPLFKKKVSGIRNYLGQNLYQHPRVVAMTDRGQHYIESLFVHYLKKPALLPPYMKTRIRRWGLKRSVCDYIAGMTDRFAQEEYERALLC
jgi:dGTPase